MKNKKKIVSLFFLLLLIFSSVLALSSCGQSETNRERLEEALYAKVSEELYTSASYETYTIAYNQAKELLKKENATALELERALEELTEAKKNLVKKADFSQLKLAVESHEKIIWVNYAGLESSPYYNVAKKYMPNGTCGVVSFGVRGGRDAAQKFMENLKLIAIETHVADARSCCLHPASTTHRQMSDAELAAAGVPADLVRLSCGLENVQDLIDDIAQALEKV